MQAAARPLAAKRTQAAFDEALAMPKPKTARIDAGPSAKLGVNGRAWHRTERQPGTAATAVRTVRRTRSANRGATWTTWHLAALPDDVDATADEADARPEPEADESIGDGLPMQIRAEQTISAIMTLSRQTAATRPASEAADATRGGEADSAMPATLASDGGKPPLAQHAAEHGRPGSHTAPTPLRSDAQAVRRDRRLRRLPSAPRSLPGRPPRLPLRSAPCSPSRRQRLHRHNPRSRPSAGNRVPPHLSRRKSRRRPRRPASGSGVQPARPAEAMAVPSKRRPPRKSQRRRRAAPALVPGKTSRSSRKRRARHGAATRCRLQRRFQ